MAPTDWSEDPFHDRNWRFQLHSWRPLDPYIVAHDLTGAPGALAKAADLMLLWREAEAASSDDALFWNDMGSGLRAAKLAYVIDHMAAGQGLDSVVREALIALARSHLRRLRVESFFSLSNHGLFQVHGLMALINVMPVAPEADHGQAFAERMFDRILTSQFGDEGVHLEHSPGYHYFVILTLRKMMASGWYDGMVHVREIIDRATAALPWFVFPNGRMAGVGDSDRNQPSFKPPEMPGFDRRMIGKTAGRFFPEAGYAIIRNGWNVQAHWRSMLLVTAGHHSHVHKHADDLSFEFYERGRFWIMDTGKYSYSRQDWRAYTDSARAHNTVQLTDARDDNGLGISKPAGGGLSSLRRSDGVWIVEGAIDRPEIGARHRREFRYRHHHSLVIIDHIELETVREVTAWLHLAPDLFAERTPDGWRFPGGQIDYRVTGAELTHVRVRGQKTPTIQGWIAEAYHDIVENDALGARMFGQTIELVTTITLDGAGD